jgi:hypothetical protein
MRAAAAWHCRRGPGHVRLHIGNDGGGEGLVYAVAGVELKRGRRAIASGYGELTFRLAPAPAGAHPSPAVVHVATDDWTAPCREAATQLVRPYDEAATLAHSAHAPRPGADQVTWAGVYLAVKDAIARVPRAAPGTKRAREPEPAAVQEADDPAPPTPTKRGRKAKLRTCACHGIVFSRPSALKRHLAPPPTTAHPCPVVGCGASFRRASQMSDHARTHTAARTIACTEPSCSDRFKDARAMRRHVAEQHGTAKAKRPKTVTPRVPLRPPPALPADLEATPEQQRAKLERLEAEAAELRRLLAPTAAPACAGIAPRSVFAAAHPLDDLFSAALPPLLFAAASPAPFAGDEWMGEFST